MQKKIIALAVAGLVSGAAFAQTNVTLYGRADLGYTYSKSDYRKFQGVENGLGIGGGSSRIGVMGEESLGNGLKAIFKFEWGLNADEGQGPTNPRYTYVGLASNFGTLTLGRNGTPSDLYMGATGPWGINGHEPIARFRANMPIIDGVRWNNSIAYASPKFSGVDFMAIYSFGERVNASNPGNPAPPNNGNGLKSADTTDASLLGLGVRYANGPLYLSAVYHLQSDDDSVRTWNSRDKIVGAGAKGWGIGGTYDFNVVKLYANYFRAKQNHASSDSKQMAWSLGVGVPVSKVGTIVAEYAQYKQDEKTKGYSVGYKHSLSKRTSLYTYLSHFNNGEGLSVGYGKTGVAGEKQSNFSVGILHVF